MPKRPRTMASAAKQAPDEASEDRRKRLRMALAVEQAVEEATGVIKDEIRQRLRARLLEYYEQKSAETRNKAKSQHGVSPESATVSVDVEQPATLTRKEISETLKGLVVMLEKQSKHDQCEQLPEPDRVSGDVDDVDMAEETTGGGDSNIVQYADDDKDDDDDDIHFDTDNDSDMNGHFDADKSENEEAYTIEDEYISSPWGVGDSSTPNNPFLEDSPQVDLMGPFHDERDNHNRAGQAANLFLRDPIILSLGSEADYENYHKRPRIDFYFLDGRP